MLGFASTLEGPEGEEEPVWGGCQLGPQVLGAGLGGARGRAWRRNFFEKHESPNAKVKLGLNYLLRVNLGTQVHLQAWMRKIFCHKQDQWENSFHIDQLRKSGRGNIIWNFLLRFHAQRTTRLGKSCESARRKRAESRKWEKIGRTLENGPRSEMGKTMAQKGRKNRKMTLFTIFAFLDHFSRFRAVGLFFVNFFSHFRLSARFPFETRRPDSQHTTITWLTCSRTFSCNASMQDGRVCEDHEKAEACQPEPSHNVGPVVSVNSRCVM